MVTSWRVPSSHVRIPCAGDWEAEKQEALDEQKRLFDAKLLDLKNRGILLDAEAKERARLEAEEESRRAEAERERVRANVVEACSYVREANHLADALRMGLQFSIRMRLSLEALASLDTRTSSAREIAVAMRTQKSGETRYV